MSKERKKMINSISNVTNSKDIEIIISDLLNNNPIDNNTFYNDDENENLIDLVFHIYKQYNNINDSIIFDIKEYEELLLQHIRVAQPMYSESHLKYLADKLTC